MLIEERRLLILRVGHFRIMLVPGNTEIPPDIVLQTRLQIQS